MCVFTLDSKNSNYKEMVARAMQEDGLESSPPLVSIFVQTDVRLSYFSDIQLQMNLYLFQDDMSDYIDYINSTLREVNIGEKVSPIHQQVFLLKLLSLLPFSLSLFSFSTLDQMCSPSISQATFTFTVFTFTFSLLPFLLSYFHLYRFHFHIFTFTVFIFNIR